MLKSAAAIAAALLIATAAQSATPTEIVQRHTASGGNVDAIMADYADDAVVLQNGRAVQGKAEIRKLFEAMFGRRAPAGGAGAPPPAPSTRPAGAPPAGGGMKVTRVWEEGNVGFMTWEMGPMRTTEEFIINKDGKIAVQAIFMTGGAPAGPRPAQ
jgi:hypothetical protein